VAETPPRDCIEHSLQGIWEGVLGVPGIGIHSSFLGAGGSSELAATMLDRVDEVLGARVPLAAFLEEPTIERLAAAVEAVPAESLPSYETFAPPDGTGRMSGLFVVSDRSTGQLVRALGRRQPTHLLPWIAIDRPTFDSVEATAAACLRIVRRLQPSGPYRLAGFCLGGSIAFEMACQLEREGEAVEALILIAPRPWTHRWFTRRFFRPIARICRLDPKSADETFARLSIKVVRWERQVDVYVERVRRWLDRPAREKLSTLVRKAGRGARRLATPSVTSRSDTPAQVTPLHPAVAARRARYRQASIVSKRVNRAYVPGPYPGRLAVLWPEHDPLDRPGLPDALWRRLASGVDVFIVRGGHHSSVTRHVESLVDQVTECLGLPQERSGLASVSESQRAAHAATSAAASVSSSA
jgi:thioesterase domain-containing protein